MKTRRMGLTGLHVSELALGAMNFGHPRFGLGEKESTEVIHAYLDAGGNFVDTADAYGGGRSEEIVGAALDGRRDSVIVATKGFFPATANFGEPPAHANALGSSRRHLTDALHASLRRLGTDWVDLYQVHCWDPQTPIEETMSTLDAFVKSGKVRHAGLSNYTAWQIAETRQLARLHGWEPFVTAQMQWSLACRTIEDDVVPVCERYGVGILAWSPLGQGVLTGKYGRGDDGPAGARHSGPPPNAAAAAWRARFVNEKTLAIAEVVKAIAVERATTPAAVSLAWLLAQRALTSAILGPRSLAHLRDGLAAADLVLPAEALARLDAVSAPPARYPEWFVAGSPRA